MFGEVLKRFAKREVFEHLPVHDACDLKSRSAVADLRVCDDIPSKFNASRFTLRSHASLTVFTSSWISSILSGSPDWLRTFSSIWPNCFRARARRSSLL